MDNITLLTKEQVWDEENKSIVIRKRGVKSETTDFAKMLGGIDQYFTKSDTFENGKDSQTARRRYGVSDVGEMFPYFSDRNDFGVRPVIKYNNVQEIPANSRAEVVKSIDGIYEVEYGYYPQSAVPIDMQRELNGQQKKEALEETGNHYAIDTRKFLARKEQVIQELKEYIYEGKRYVKLEIKRDDEIGYKGQALNVQRLSNSNSYLPGYDSVWFEVEPLKWLIDPEQKLMISKNLLFSGVPFSSEFSGEENNIEFEESQLGNFLNNFFIDDIQQKYEIGLNNDYSDYKKEYKNASESLGFDFKSSTPEDIMRACIISDIPIYLHGDKGEGKSDRVLQQDKDATILYLGSERDESLNGTSVYNPEKDMVIDKKPEWLVKLEDKCEKEPDKIHILFFDELSNAEERMQKMIYNIVLKKEVNGRWNLPEQVRIVAAGNERKDSGGATELLEPLYDRFAHVNIVTTVDNWIDWATNDENEYGVIDFENAENQRKTKIHPAIIAFIAYKEKQGIKVLRTEFNGVEPNADPRKWQMASNLLYGSNKPYMLKALIGEELATEFAEFCKQKVISIDDVINNNYENEKLRMNSARAYATVTYLANVSEEYEEKVREFIGKIGEEYVQVFDKLREGYKNSEQEADSKNQDDGQLEI